MFILASSSPRRKELLKKLITDFEIISPNIDERLLDDSFSPSKLSAEESKLKAYAVKSLHPNDEILSCDTIVVLDGEALGKPKDEKAAFEMLKKANGKKQVVLSSYTYLGKGKEISRTVRSYVYFNRLSDEEILDYIRKYQPFDKAGGYGIQDEAGLISHIEGSYDNVMGLPTEDIAKHVFNK